MGPRPAFLASVWTGSSRRSVGTLERAFLVAALLAWTTATAASAWGAKAFDLSALIVGARVLERHGFAALYEHDREFYNRASTAAFSQEAGALGFDDTPTPFVHAPLVAIASRPLAAMAYLALEKVWVAAATAATLAGLLLAALHFAPETFRGRPYRFGALLVLLLGFEPIRYALWLGQTTPFVFLAVTAALYAEGRGRGTAGGLVLAIPAFLKLSPVLFAVPWLWRRQYRAAGACAAGVGTLATASLAGAGWGPNLAYLARVREIAGETVVAYNNHGLAAVIERLKLPPEEVMRWRIIPLAFGTRAVVAAAGALLAAGAWWALAPLERERRDRLAIGVIAALTLLLPTIAWTHYFILLVPPALGIWEIAADIPQRAWVRAGLLAALALCSRPLFLDEIGMHRGPVTLIVGPTLSAGLIYVLVIVVARALRQTRR